MYIERKHMNIPKLIISLMIILSMSISLNAQEEKVIDQVVAIVGQNIILESEVENQYYQYRMQSGAISGGSSIRCQMLETLLFQKLLLNQAELDSIVISEIQVQQKMDQRLRYFIAQLGSRERFEEYYGKSVEEFKVEFYKEVENQEKIGKLLGDREDDMD